MVLEALCGASYQELVDDYFITYHNYYGVSKGTHKYDLIKKIRINVMIRYIFNFTEGTNLLTANYSSHARAYLKSTGLSDQQIEQLIIRLTGYTY